MRVVAVVVAHLHRHSSAASGPRQLAYWHQSGSQAVVVMVAVVLVLTHVHLQTSKTVGEEQDTKLHHVGSHSVVDVDPQQSGWAAAAAGLVQSRNSQGTAPEPVAVPRQQATLRRAGAAEGDRSGEPSARAPPPHLAWRLRPRLGPIDRKSVV